MLTWAKGRGILAAKLHKVMPPVHQFIVDLASHPPNRIDGDAVFLAGNPYAIPVALSKNVKHNRVLHNRTVLLNFQVEDVPRVPNFEKVQTEKLGGGFHRISARYGFMEELKLETVLTLASGQGLDLNIESTSFYVGRENLSIGETSSMARWRASLFIFMSRNAADASSFFNLPPNQVIEVGARMSI
jgi:KUP system potassium uptake protein